MRNGPAVLAIIAGLASTSGAQGQVFEILPPPMLEPQYALGARYWQSVGKTRFSINSSRQNPAYGNPTSVLTYEDMDGFSGEFFWYARNDYNTFAKGFIGGGAVLAAASTTRTTSPARSNSPTRTVRSKATI